MSSQPETGECTAHSKTSDEECDCIEYVESPELPGYCSNCYHRLEYHLVSTPGATKQPDSVKLLLRSIMSNGPLKGKGAAGPSKPRPFSSTLPVVSSKKSSTHLSAEAHKEANHGMCSPSKGPNKTSKKGKERKRDSSGGDTFKVVSIVVVGYGTKFVKGTLQIDGSDKVPDRVQTQNAVLDGLAVVNSKGIEFDSTASHEDIVAVFLDLLPLVFTYFAQIQREAEDDDEPAWCLATPVRNKLVIVPVTHPDGSVIDFNKGNATTGYKSNRIFIVSRKPIPVELLQEWAKSESSFRKPIGTGDDDSEEAVSDAEDASKDETQSPEQIPSMNKRRLFSRSSSEEAEERPAKKPKKVESSRDGRRRKWARGQSPKGSDFIDLTAEDTRRSTPEFSRTTSTTAPSAADTLPSPTRSESGLALGNPYDQNTKFYF